MEILIIAIIIIAIIITVILWAAAERSGQVNSDD